MGRIPFYGAHNQLLMEEKMRTIMQVMSIALAAALLTSGAFADDLSIYDVQFNTSDGDASVYDGQIHNVTGGVVSHKWSGWQKRVYLQNPDFPEWGAIVLKDWEDGAFYDAVEIGDFVSFTDIKIEEYRGATYLRYDHAESPELDYTIESQGNPLPAPTVLTAADLAVPVDHAASEPYESMICTLEDVTVGQMDLGKEPDNYELLQGDDVAWGADYMNVDAGGLYHPYIYPGAQLSSITGIVDQYTKLSNNWDYYQLITRSTADIVPEPSGLALLALGLFVTSRRR